MRWANKPIRAAPRLQLAKQQLNNDIMAQAASSLPSDATTCSNMAAQQAGPALGLEPSGPPRD